ncbi:hypothetical protein J2W96_006202 [Variovorax guangxiensis]|nr:hypothetical protein [Variovorax guangxiensis]
MPPSITNSVPVMKRASSLAGNGAALAVSRPYVSRAWTWQYVTLARGDDLTRSTLTARHAEGADAGQFHDSDFAVPCTSTGTRTWCCPRGTQGREGQGQGHPAPVMV